MSDGPQQSEGLTDFVSVDYTLGDQYAVIVRTWRYFVKMWLLVLAICAVISAFGGIENLRDYVFDGAMMFVLGCVIGVAHFGVTPLYSQYQSRRLMAKGPIRMRLTDEGVDIRTAEIDSLVRWARIKRVVQSGDRLLLFISGCSAFVLVRGRMIDDDGFATWERIARDHAGQRSA